MKNYLLFRIVVTLIGLASTGSVCAENGANAPYKIGVIQSLTGAASEDGTSILRAIQLAADEINATSGPKVELLVEDDGTQPKNTVSAYQKLKTQGVEAIIGPSWSFLTNSIAPIAARDKKVIFTSSNFPEMFDLSLYNGYLFTNALPLKSDVKPFEQFLNERSIKSAFLITANTTWGTTQAEYYRKILTGRQISIVEDFKTTQVEDNSWRDVLLRVRSKKPDLILFFLSKNDSELILRQAQELKLPVQFYGATHTYDGWMQTKTKEVFEGVCFTYPYQQLRRAKDFYAKHQARFGTPPLMYADSSYDALFLVWKALQESASKKTPLDQALREISFEGIVGQYKYSSEQSLAIGNSSLLCVKGGELVTL